jgi:hypothetical protein
MRTVAMAIPHNIYKINDLLALPCLHSKGESETYSTIQNPTNSGSSAEFVASDIIDKKDGKAEGKLGQYSPK